MRRENKIRAFVMIVILLYSIMLPFSGCGSGKSTTPTTSSTGTTSPSVSTSSPKTSSNGGGAQETIVYSFGPASGTDGQNPFGGVMLGKDGYLYGTTHAGGAHGTGTVFKLSISGTESILHSFAVNGGPGGDARFPMSGVALDNSGNIWGTASYGGNDNHGNGTVFEISASGTESLYSIVVNYTIGGVTSPFGGSTPESTPIMDATGNIYVTAAGGGPNTAATVYKISGGATSVFYSFLTPAFTGGPLAGLIKDNAGNFYGVTTGGQVFEITAEGVESTLYSFTSGQDELEPDGLLTRDSTGNLYGTTAFGGPYWLPPGDSNPGGTVFKISPSGTKTTLYSFGKSANDGQKPYCSVILDSSGNLYGTTNVGGAHGDGTLFKVSSSGAMTILYSFGASATDGQNPYGAIVLDDAGNIYGTTSGGGANGTGAVFKYHLSNK